MAPAQYINISLEAFGLVFALILLIFLLASNDTKDKQGKIFVAILAANIFAMAANIIAVYWNGSQDSGVQLALKIANLAFFVFCFLFTALFDYYIFSYIRQNKQITKVYITLIFIASGALIVLASASYFNGSLYYIDDGNSFCHGSLYPLVYILELFVWLVEIVQIIAGRKSLNRLDFVAIICTELLPLMIFFAPLPDGVSLTNAVMVVTTLVLYGRIQVTQGKRLAQKELELTEARIDAMLSQIQPHFIYNTLATIQNLIRKDGERAAELVNKFAVYLRDNVDSLTQKGKIPFSRELEHIQTYLNIEKARFGDHINVVYDLEFTDFMLPILTVQPIVENAVRYGVTKKPEGGTVTITTRRDFEGVKITVSDDGVGFDDETKPYLEDGRSHVGIKNVRNRLRAQCDASLNITSEIGVGTTAVIFIPQG